MHVIVHNDEEQYTVECGDGSQKVRWLARVFSQRVSADGIWCPPSEEKLPKRYVPGRVFALPEEDELDGDASIADVIDSGTGVKVELLLTPAVGVPAVGDDSREKAVVLAKNEHKANVCAVNRIDDRNIEVCIADLDDPADYEGFSFNEVWSGVNLEDLLQNEDSLLRRSIKNYFRRIWVDVIDIYKHYSESPFDETIYQTLKKRAGRKLKKDEVEPVPAPPIMTPRKFALFVRTCRLTDAGMPFYHLLRSSVRDAPPDETGEDDAENLGNREFTASAFMESIARIANVKITNLFALVDKLHTLIHTFIFPYATGDLIDPVRDAISVPPVQSSLFNNQRVLWKLYRRHFRPEAETKGGPRAMTTKRLYQMLKGADQFDDELSSSDLLVASNGCFTFDIPKGSLTLENDSIELSFIEFQECMCRCALLRFKNPDERIEQKVELFFKRVVRATGV